MNLISTRAIWLRPSTVLETTGEGGGLLLNIGLILKWFITVQPIFDSFNTYAGVESLNSRLYLLLTFTYLYIIKE